MNRKDSQDLTRVGPGTPMGNLMRQYWVPAMLSSELAGPDSDPVRVLLLGENLIAFRDTTGTVGLLANHGVRVLADDIEQAYLRAMSFEWRCRQAWHIAAAVSSCRVVMNSGFLFSP